MKHPSVILANNQHACLGKTKCTHQGDTEKKLFGKKNFKNVIKASKLTLIKVWFKDNLGEKKNKSKSET